MDIYPCTVDETKWDTSVSMQVLFGHLCSDTIFAHDVEMAKLLQSRRASRGKKRQLDNSHEMHPSDIADEANGSLSDSAHSSLKNLEQPKIRSTQGWTAKRPRTTKITEEQKTPELSSAAVYTITTTSTTTSDEMRVRAIRTTLDAKLCRNTAISHSEENGGLAAEHTPSFRDGGTRRSSLYERKAVVATPGTLAPTDAINSNDYQCQWLACSRTFGSRSGLRQHVLGQHMVGTRHKGIARFECMWTGCQSLEDNVFSSREAWEEHMDTQHYCHAVTGPVLLANEPDQPGGTEDQPIELSDGPDSDGDEGSTTNTELTYDDEESQLSISDSAFDSQHATHPTRRSAGNRIFHRKEAYKAAIGRGERDWAMYSPFPSSNAEVEQEMEL